MSRKIYCDGCSCELHNGDAVFIFGNEGYCEECFRLIVEEQLSEMGNHELADLLGADVEYIGENKLATILVSRVIPSSDENNYNYLFGYYNTQIATGNTTGEELKINSNLNTGEMLIVDCRKETRSIIKIDATGEEVNYLKHKSGVWLSLKNAENEISIKYDGTAQANIKWKECY